MSADRNVFPGTPFGLPGMVPIVAAPSLASRTQSSVDAG